MLQKEILQSLSIENLFIKVPLNEKVDIISNTVYHHSSLPTLIYLTACTTRLKII